MTKPTSIVEEVRNLLAADEYIEAVKRVRAVWRYGLKESKDFVDFVRNNPKLDAPTILSQWCSLHRLPFVDCECAAKNRTSALGSYQLADDVQFDDRGNFIPPKEEKNT